MGNMALGKASATSVQEAVRSDIPDGRLWVTPAYYQTTGDAAVQLDSADDWIAARIVPQTDMLISSVSRYVTAEATQGDGTLAVYSDSTAVEPNGDLNGSATACHEDQTDNSTPLTVSATSEDGGGANDAYLAFEGSTGYWKSADDPATTAQDLEIDFGAGNEKTVNKLIITAANEADANSRCFPKTFTIQLHDGTSYSTVKTVSSSTDPGQALKQVHTFTNGTAMQKAKINITDNHGTGAFVCVGEMEWVEAESTSAPGTELQELGTLSSGGSADAWTRLAVASGDQYQAQRGIPIWLIMKGAAAADWSESIRRPNTVTGSAMPDEMNLCKYTTDGGTTWTQALQNDLPAMWNVVVNSVASDHVPQLCYGRYTGRYVYIPGSGMVEIPEAGLFMDCSALTAGTEYYAYLLYPAGTLLLDTTLTAPSTVEGVLAGTTLTRYLGMIVPKALISTHQGPVSVKDRRLVSNLYNRRVVSVGKPNPYSSGTNDTTGLLWERWMDNDDWLVELVCAVACPVRVRAGVQLRNQAAQTVYLAIGLNSRTQPPVNATVTQHYSNYEYDNHHVELLDDMPPGYHYLVPLIKQTGTIKNLVLVDNNGRYADFRGTMEA
jgi:hypothetical protein